MRLDLIREPFGSMQSMISIFDFPHLLSLWRATQYDYKIHLCYGFRIRSRQKHGLSGILAQLLTSGFTPSQLAYIKPVTQCIAKQTVALFCEQTKIPCIDIGNLVFRKGFSRDFIDGLTKHSDELLADVVASILSYRQGQKCSHY